MQWRDGSEMSASSYSLRILYAHTGLLIFVRKVRKHHIVINGKLQGFLITELQGLWLKPVRWLLIPPLAFL